MKLPPPERDSAFAKLLDKITTSKETEDDLRLAHAELEAHHEAHQRSMSRSDVSTASVDSLVAALHASTAATIAQTAAVAAVAAEVAALRQPTTREGVVDLPGGPVRMRVTNVPAESAATAQALNQLVAALKGQR